VTPPVDVAELVEHSAAPATVATRLTRLSEEHADLADRLADDTDLLRTLIAVLGASRSLSQLCQTDPQAIEVLANLSDRLPCDPADVDGLVRWKRLEYLRIAARDLSGHDSLEVVGAGLARMADDVLAAAWRLTGTAAIEGIAVIAMGKYGGRELNYASDVDLLFVGEGDVRPVLAIAGRCFRVDADLRPEGRDGPLVRSLPAYTAYWARWARTWEFQALLKARPAAGDPTLGEAFATAADAAVWGRPFGSDELREVRAMKAAAEGEMARLGLTDRELKRGRGGIRDIEFAVQLLQLVHGPADRSIRSAATLTALDQLAAAGFVGGDDARRLAQSYRFLRTVEHRLQLRDEAQVHAVPAGGEDLEHLARVCGYHSTPASDAIGLFVDDLRQHQATARSLHERLFFRPLLEAFADVAAMSPVMGTPAAIERLSAFGFADAQRTRSALIELTRGLTRRSRLMRQVLPLILDWLSESPDPDSGLLGLRTLADEPHRAEALIRLSRDTPDGTRRLCLLLGSSRLITGGLQRHPELMADLADPLLPSSISATELRTTMATSLAWRDTEQRTSALRRLVDGEQTRIGMRDLLGTDDTPAVAASLTTLAEAVLEESLRIVVDSTGATVPIALIAMGRFGGDELSYASDLDVMVVHGGTDDRAAAAAEHVAAELLRLVNGRTPAERLYPLDLDLRPEGKRGPLARTLAGYQQYYERWAAPWERQALLRSRFAVGDPEVGARFAAIGRAFVAHLVTSDDEREIRRMKARIERERLPTTDDRDFHLKLGRGGLADVEWTVQLLQLRHDITAVPGTMAALRALSQAGHIETRDAAILAAAYEFCERTRNRLYLVRGSPGNALPMKPDQLGKLARSLNTTGPELRDEYRRITRRCREVVERLFYGDEGSPAPRRPYRLDM